MKKHCKYFEKPANATIPMELNNVCETVGNYESCDKDVENMEINAKFAIDAYPYPKHRIDLGMGVYEIGPGVFCGEKGLEEFNKAILESLRKKNNDSIKKRKMDKETKELILSWFNHIEQLATDRKTLNGYVMDYQDCLDEIRCISKNSQDFINKHY